MTRSAPVSNPSRIRACSSVGSNPPMADLTVWVSRTGCSAITMGPVIGADCLAAFLRLCPADRVTCVASFDHRGHQEATCVRIISYAMAVHSRQFE